MAKTQTNPDKDDRRQLRTRLIRRQFQFHGKRPHALVLIVAGYLSSDMEDAVDHLLDWMDPRNIRVYALNRYPGRGDELMDNYRPPQGRYWRRLPGRGEIAVFHGGWYGPLLAPGTLDDDSLGCLCRLEAMLQAEKVHILKVWLDRPAAGVRQRLKKLQADTASAWRVSAQDRAIAQNLAAYRRQVARVLTETACNGGAPWHTLPLDHSPAKWEELAALTLDALKTPPPKPAARRLPAAPRRAPPALPLPGGEFSKHGYEAQLAHWQGRLRRLTASPGFAKRSLVIAFEGYDAAGKGGAIRRLARGIDPAQLAVVPIAAPTAEDRLYPYLWRFWRHVPPYHEVTIFDRSWYGRVLVERVEGFARRADWQRAYEEIRDFEEELTAHGVVLVKIWLQLSAGEQRRRFEARAKTPYKQYKLTPADLKNAQLRPQYEKAVAEMLARTHERAAPWAVIAADDKRTARIATLRHVVETLAAALKLDG